MRGAKLGMTYEERYGKEKALEIASKISKAKKGKSHEEIYGREQSSRLKENLRNKLKGVKKSLGAIEKVRIANIGKHHSEETKQKMRLSHPREKYLGEKNHNWGVRKELASNWRGGITPIRVKIMNLDIYKKWRLDIFERDNFTCCNCHGVGGYLEAHHLNEFIRIIKENKIETIDEALNCKELWNINNGITLCKVCHNLTKKYNHFESKLNNNKEHE